MVVVAEAVRQVWSEIEDARRERRKRRREGRSSVASNPANEEEGEEIELEDTMAEPVTTEACTTEAELKAEAALAEACTTDAEVKVELKAEAGTRSSTDAVVVVDDTDTEVKTECKVEVKTEHILKATWDRYLR